MIHFHAVFQFSFQIVSYAAGAYVSNLLKSHPIKGGIFMFFFFILIVKFFINFYAFSIENAFRESKLLVRNIKKGDFITLRRTQIR